MDLIHPTEFEPGHSQPGCGCRGRGSDSFQTSGPGLLFISSSQVPGYYPKVFRANEQPRRSGRLSGPSECRRFRRVPGGSKLT
eukprot:461688-Hanusia_phi.AAC.1